MRKAWARYLIGMALDSTILHHATNLLYHPTSSIYLIYHHEWLTYQTIGLLILHA